jgi:hypothetical protein
MSRATFTRLNENCQTKKTINVKLNSALRNLTADLDNQGTRAATQRTPTIRRTKYAKREQLGSTTDYTEFTEFTDGEVSRILSGQGGLRNEKMIYKLSSRVRFFG